MTNNNAVKDKVEQGSGSLAAYALHPYLQPSLLAFDPQDEKRIVAGGSDSGLFISTDEGVSWRLLTNPLGSELKDANGKPIPDLPRPRFAHFNGKDLYIGTQGRGVWKIGINFELTPDTDDQAGSNDTRPTATNLPAEMTVTRDSRNIHNDSDEDYYKFTAQSTGKLLVNLGFDSLRGQLNVEAYDSINAPNPVVAALTTEDIVEHLKQKRILIDVVKGKDYFIRVFSATKHTNHYNLEVKNVAPFTIAIDGGQGSNTFHGANQINTWTITGNDAGTLNNQTGDINFSHVNNLIGGEDIDKFTLKDKQSITGAINGGNPAGLNTIEFSDATKARVTSRNAGTAKGIGGGFKNITTFISGLDKDRYDLVNGGILRGSGSINSSGGEDTLVGDNTTNRWVITGPDSGEVTGLNDGFAGFENLVGGFADDEFIISDNVNFAGTIGGGDGNDIFRFVGTGTINGVVSGGGNAEDGADVLDLSGMSGPIVFDLASPNFRGIEKVIGNGQNSTLIGLGGSNTWTITGENDGTVNGITFVDFNNLVGGSGVDTFNFTKADEVVPVLHGARVPGIDPPQDPSENGEEEEVERVTYGEPPLTGNVLARIRTQPSGVNASLTRVADTSLSDPGFAGVGGAYGGLEIEDDGSYTYKVELSEPEVRDMVLGETLTDTFAYTVQIGTETTTANLIVTIRKTEDRLELTDNINSINITGTVSGGPGDDIFNFANDALITGRLSD